MIRTSLVLIISFFSMANCSAAASQSFTSSEYTPMTLELYTSQGCSSCPRAEKWISGLKYHPELFKRLFPLAFHVDYWDYLGWKDSFASKAATERQYLYNRLGLTRGVYTPGLVVNGSESRNWRFPQIPPGEIKTGSLKLVLDSQHAQLQFSQDLPDLKAHLAILEMSAQLKIRRGENAGRTINHDFVVQQWQTLSPRNVTSVWQFTAPQRDADKEQAIVAWISQGQNPKPIQMVGGWLH